MTIKYVHKLGTENKFLTEFNNVPDNILELIQNNDYFMESKTFGQKGLGNPDEIETLIIDERTFTYYNKGIHYMFSGDKTLQPVFQVFTYFMGETR